MPPPAPPVASISEAKPAPSGEFVIARVEAGLNRGRSRICASVHVGATGMGQRPTGMLMSATGVLPSPHAASSGTRIQARRTMCSSVRVEGAPGDRRWPETITNGYIRRVTRLALLAGLLAATGAAGAAPIRAPLTYLDGGEPRTVTRLGTRDASGREHVRLVHPRTGAPIAATLGREALVQLDADDATVLHAAGLVPVRLVAPAQHVWLVRGADGEDGLDVAARLTARSARGVAGAIPGLAFPHFRAAPAVR